MIEIQKLKTLKSLTLANAILLTLAIIPWFGIIVIDYGGIIAIVVLAILILKKQKGLALNPTPNYFVFCGAILSLITILLAVLALVGFFQLSRNQLTPIALLVEKNILIGTILVYVVGFFAWCCYLVAMIMYWINLSQLNKMIYKYEYEMLMMSQQNQNL